MDARHSIGSSAHLDGEGCVGAGYEMAVSAAMTPCRGRQKGVSQMVVAATMDDEEAMLVLMLMMMMELVEKLVADRLPIGLVMTKSNPLPVMLSQARSRAAMLRGVP